jgi:putative ABC transport system permease protein
MKLATAPVAGQSPRGDALTADEERRLAIVSRFMNLPLALRRLRSAPGFTVAAILTLALGIGANALTFSAIRALLFQPLPFRDGDDLVWAQGANPALALTGQPISGDEVEALAAMTAAEGVGVIGTAGLIRAVGPQREEWRGLWVTTNALSLLKLSPALGRSFESSDFGAAAAKPAMIGYERWQRDFGGDPGILGRTLQFEDSKAITVIGVLPRGLEFPFGRAPGTGTGSEFGVGVQDFWRLGQNRPGDNPGGIAFARIRPGASIEAAQAEADALVRRLPRAQAADAARTVRLTTFRDHALGVLRPALPLLEGFAALVLLIACANLANLVLARAAKARGEFAVRTALGASTADLVRIALTESLLVCGAGTMAGVLLASTARTFLVTFAAGQIGAVERIRIDSGVILFAAVLGVTVACACAVLPVRLFRDAPAVSMLDRGARGHTLGPRQSRTFKVLVIVQVAITLVLLNAAALVFRSLSRLMSVDTGYQTGTVIAADVLLYEPYAVVAAYFQRLNERLRSVPGVEAVGLVQSTPLTGKWTFRERVSVAGGDADPRHEVDVAGAFVAFDYFDAMSIPVIAGRSFTAREYLTGAQRPLIINDVAARLFFPGENAIGRELVLNRRPREVVGVVKGTRDVRLDAGAEPQFYQPAFTGGSQVIVRTSAPLAVFAETLRRELVASDPRLIVKRVEPLTAIVESSVFERQLATRLLVAFAGLALVLAMVGLYGVLHFTTIQRRRELGVRAALGASPVDLVRMVLGEGLAMALAGAIAGLLVSAFAAAWLQSLLFEITARDPLTAIAATALLAITAAAACALPAWRAASVSPAITLRAE